MAASPISVPVPAYARLAFAIGALALLFSAAPQAVAHDDEHHRLKGSRLTIKSQFGGGNANKFKFKVKDEFSIGDISLIDPRSSHTSVSVRDRSGSGGDTNAVQLDPAGWRMIGKDTDIKGWKYKGDISLPSSGGVRSIVLKGPRGSKGGKLVISAKGIHWPLLGEFEQELVDVQLHIDTETYCAEFCDSTKTTCAVGQSAEFKKNEVGKVVAKDATRAPECEPVCGNGILELGEECDDGNNIENVEGDTCNNSCEGCLPEDVDFDSTFEGIQALIFDDSTYNCTNSGCHGNGTSPSGGLDLRNGFSYANLVSVPSQIDPQTVRVFPGDQDLSMLYNKIAAKTLFPDGPTVPGSVMPTVAATVTTAHLEALRLWIRGGAPETGVVEGTAELLGSCLPQPDPLKIPQPAVPDPNLGAQFAMPGYDLPSQSETELCVPSFYDLRGTVPAQFLVDCPGVFPGTNDDADPLSGKCFAYKTHNLSQDPQSHHSIVHIYAGAFDYDDAGWGTWTCFGGANDGLGCDPAVTPTQCPDGVCGGTPREGAACLSTPIPFGPSDYGNANNNAPTWSGAQESTAFISFPSGVYRLLPLRGVIVWNSHAFNLTNTDMDMEAWINVEYTDDQQFEALQLFNTDYIFTQLVPPFESREYCATHTFAEGTRLFEISSHGHRHMKHWRYFDPPQTPCGDGGPAPSIPLSVGLATDPSCVPSGTEFYANFDYSDALRIDYDPPRHFTGSVADRTIKFCARFSNGEDEPADVKTWSGSPSPPLAGAPGGPCNVSERACIGGTQHGELCSIAGCPGGVCDACPLRGGITTEDEMFIPIGTFYLDP